MDPSKTLGATMFADDMNLFYLDSFFHRKYKTRKNRAMV